MAKRASVEERVLQYFRTAPQNEMELLFKLVQGEVKQRRGAAMQPALPRVPKRKRTRVGKATGAQTAFDTSTMQEAHVS